MNSTEKVIEQTKKWITNVVIGCNLCPFAAQEVKRGSVHYEVTNTSVTETALQELLQECVRLDNYAGVETSFLIFPAGFAVFYDYLDLLVAAEKMLKTNGYEGVYQLASFHPEYCFADVPVDDAANYTNRSVYPMLHLLREASIENALKSYSHPEQIPERNMIFAREKGIAYMKMLRDACLQ